MAGTISLSLSQQFDAQGRPLSGGLLYFFSSGTTTPQNAFQDFALTIVHPNPIILDASGRVPAFYLADGFIKIRLADENGVTVIAADGLLVVGPSTGTGGGTSVDPNAVLATGDIKARYGIGSLTGFVRCNGNTIGSAAASTTERSNADCQALFEFLWTNNASLVVSGGRGASANADWLANKSIALPDLRGRTIAGMDDMGASAGAAGRLTSTWFGVATTTMGNAGGSQSHQLTVAQLPAITPAGSVTGISASGSVSGVSASGSVSGVSASGSISGSAGAPSISIQTFDVSPGGSGPAFSPNGTAGLSPSGIAVGGSSVSGSCSVSGGTGSCSISGGSGSCSVSGGSGTFTGTAFGSNNSHPTVTPAMVMTFYIKL